MHQHGQEVDEATSRTIVLAHTARLLPGVEVEAISRDKEVAASTIRWVVAVLMACRAASKEVKLAAWASEAEEEAWADEAVEVVSTAWVP